MGLNLGQISSITKGRANSQAQFTIESSIGTVKAVYPSAGNDNGHFDVLVDGQVSVLPRVPNGTSQKWWAGARVVVNYVKGNKLQPQIVGGAGGSTASVLSGNASSQMQGSISESGFVSNLNGVPFVLWDTSDAVDDALVAMPGVNIELMEVPGQLSYGNPTNGTLTINMKIPSYTELPDPVAFSLLWPDGTIIGVVDSYYTTKTLYELHTALQKWVQLI